MLTFKPMKEEKLLGLGKLIETFLDFFLNFTFHKND